MLWAPNIILHLGSVSKVKHDGNYSSSFSHTCPPLDSVSMLNAQEHCNHESFPIWISFPEAHRYSHISPGAMLVVIEQHIVDHCL